MKQDGIAQRPLGWHIPGSQPNRLFYLHLQTRLGGGRGRGNGTVRGRSCRSDPPWPSCPSARPAGPPLCLPSPQSQLMDEPTLPPLSGPPARLHERRRRCECERPTAVDPISAGVNPIMKQGRVALRPLGGMHPGHRSQPIQCRPRWWKGGGRTVWGWLCRPSFRSRCQIGPYCPPCPFGRPSGHPTPLVPPMSQIDCSCFSLLATVCSHFYYHVPHLPSCHATQIA